MTILKSVLAIIVGYIVGSIVNMALVYLGPTLIVLPEGVDMTTTEGIKAAMPLLQAKHFIFPFLAHALGTLVGSIVAAAMHRKLAVAMSLIIGVIFLIGGIVASVIIPAPTWFIVVDLVLAYIPMSLWAIFLLRNK